MIIRRPEVIMDSAECFCCQSLNDFHVVEESKNHQNMYNMP